MLDISKVLSKLIKTNEDSNYILIGNVGICWGNTSVTASNYSGSTNVALPLTYKSSIFVYITPSNWHSTMNEKWIYQNVGNNKINIAYIVGNTGTFTTPANWLTIGFVDRGGGV